MIPLIIFSTLHRYFRSASFIIEVALIFLVIVLTPLVNMFELLLPGEL